MTLIDPKSKRAEEIREAFKSWVSAQPKNRTYNFNVIEDCAVGLYCQEKLGVKMQKLTPHQTDRLTAEAYDVLHATHYDRCDVFMAASNGEDICTFGALAEMLEYSPKFKASVDAVEGQFDE